ncbi:unnamed protein product [Caenorhabditis auriculariae]|uniref:Lethal giant larvae homologue 2 domain-containing protein n=1 Tax=Caenorhabditis auriculariae TaxID=2777116 RepID=A0A8S1GQJ1_9PELO|nr:unnamed protein product [Caenorhabditis auriculariae]
MFKYIRQRLESGRSASDIHFSSFVDWKKSNRYGFPYNTSCMAYDPVLKVLALGTKEGDIVLSGYPGVFWEVTVSGKGAAKEVKQLYFMNGTGYFIALFRDGGFTRYKINGSKIREDMSTIDARMKSATSCHSARRFPDESPIIYIGTVSGNVYSLLPSTMEVHEFFTFDNVRRELESDEEIKNALAQFSSKVSSLCVKPDDPSLMLIMLGRSVALLMSANHMVASIRVPVEVNDVVWDKKSDNIFMAHTDGQFTTWKAKTFYTGGHYFEKQETHELFGPYPCDEMTRLAVLNNETRTNNKPHIPLVAYMGVTVRHAGKTLVYQFASKVLDIIGAECLEDGTKLRKDVLLVLTEYELVAIDIADERWRAMTQQVFFPLNASPITAQLTCSSIEEHVWRSLLKMSEVYWKQKDLSDRQYPMTAGMESKISAERDSRGVNRQLFITGHFDGRVTFWATTPYSMRQLFILKTSDLFKDEEEKTVTGTLSSKASGMSLPVMEVGEYDEYCDDERLSIVLLNFDPKTGAFVCTNRCGAILVYSYYDEDVCLKLESKTIKWELEGTKPNLAKVQPLYPRREAVYFPAGYQPFRTGLDAKYVQLAPCVPIKTLSYHADLHMLAVGSMFGYALLDYRKYAVVENVFLGDNVPGDALNMTLNRFRSMKKSIRQTFRRKNRSSTPNTTVDITSDPEETFRPVERKIEGRATASDGPPPNYVTCIKVLRIPTTNPACLDDVVAIGTSQGSVIIYKLHEPKTAIAITAYKWRELRLSHGAPIVEIDLSCEAGNSPSPQQRLMVFTEEQIRGFSVPDLRSTRIKYKITSVEGTRIKNAAVVKLPLKRDPGEHDMFACVVTNSGTVNIHSLSSPRKRVEHEVFKPSDIAGMNSAQITQEGELSYLGYGGQELHKEVISAHSRRWLEPMKGVVLESLNRS